MNSIRTLFLKKSPLFIPFMIAGFPDLDQSLDVILTLSELGADLIELGVPFSDPIADGSINQHAYQVALEKGTNLDDIYSLIKNARNRNCNTPIILFSYYNPILAYGLESFIFSAKQAGANGILIVDLPPEEGIEVYTQIKEAGLDIILLISPTTHPSRYPIYQKLDPCFIYYISRLAVTGVQNAISHTLNAELLNLKKVFINTPIAVGFGISTLEQANEIGQYADGVIVGSMLVDLLKNHGISDFKIATKNLIEAISK
jgi:tryptophan synthase alpha subunit